MFTYPMHEGSFLACSPRLSHVSMYFVLLIGKLVRR